MPKDAKSGKRAKADARFGRGLPPWTGRLILTLVAVALLGYAFDRAGRVLLAHWRSSPDAKIVGSQIDFGNRPPWILVDVPTRAMTEAGWTSREFPLEDPTWLAEIHDLLLRSPWIASARVTRDFHRVLVAIEYRRPEWCVPREPDTALYLDREGIVLPAKEADPRLLRASLVLEGTEPTGPIDLGQPFPDARIPRLGELLKFLDSERDAWGLLTVELLPNGPSRPPACVLHTRGGSRIRWGAIRAEDRPPDEPTWEEKRSMLQTVRTSQGSLDGPDGPFEYDVRSVENFRPIRIADPRPRAVPDR